MGGNAKYWVAVGYPENMREDWQEKIGDLVELPYAYCIHDKDMLAVDPESEQDHDERKIHVHIILVFPNTTTYKHALSTFQKLSRQGAKAFNKCEQIINIRNKYNYLIHNTETCKKLGKYQYDPEERIEGNNFDIGAYEQIGLEEKEKIRRELSKFILDNQIITYSLFYALVLDRFGTQYESIVVNYQGHFDKLCKGCYHQWERMKQIEERAKTKETEK